MPARYEALKRQFLKRGMSEQDAERRAAAIHNSLENKEPGPKDYVTRGYDKKKGK